MGDDLAHPSPPRRLPRLRGGTGRNQSPGQPRPRLAGRARPGGPAKPHRRRAALHAARLCAPPPGHGPPRRHRVGRCGRRHCRVSSGLFPGQPGRPTIAFADVEQAMQQVETLSWETEERTDNRPGQKFEGTNLTFINWLRRDPPAIAMTDFNWTPSHDFDIDKTLMDVRGALSLSKRECFAVPLLKVSVKQRVERQIRGLTQFPQNTPPSEAKAQVQTTATNLHQTYVSVNGQRQARFDRDVMTVWTLDDGHTTHRLVHVTTWADPETHRIVRIEAHVSEDTTGIRPFSTMIQDHFQYNQTPPKGTFDWSPPAGVRVVRMQSGPAEK